MIIFSDLKINQAVFFNGKYVVQLPAGKFIDSQENKINGGEQVVMDDLYIFCIVENSPKVLKYIFDDGTEKTPEDYSELIKESSQYQDEWGDHQYPSIEIEFDIRKRMEAYAKAEKVYSESTVEYKPVEIEVIGSVEGTESKFIETPFQYGQATWKPYTGIYKVHTSKISVDEWYELEKENPNNSFNNKSVIGKSDNKDLRFAKIDDYFVFTSIKDKPFINSNNSVEIFSDLNEAKQREHQIRCIIRKEVAKHTNTDKIQPKTLGYVVRELENLFLQFKKVESKQKTQFQKRSAINRFNSLIDELKGQLEK